jgi:hypothetical protein
MTLEQGGKEVKEDDYVNEIGEIRWMPTIYWNVAVIVVVSFFVGLDIPIIRIHNVVVIHNDALKSTLGILTSGHNLVGDS